MDSFILYNAEIYTPTDIKALALEQEKFINEKSSVQTQEISEMMDITDTQEKLEETKNPDFPSKQISKTILTMNMRPFGTWSLMDQLTN